MAAAAWAAAARRGGMAAVGSPKGRDETTVIAALPKHSPEIDATEWWQALKSDDDFVVDPLDKGGNGGLPVPQVSSQSVAQWRHHLQCCCC